MDVEWPMTIHLIIATDSFSGTRAVAAMTAFGLFQSALITLGALSWGKLVPARIVATGQPT